MACLCMPRLMSDKLKIQIFKIIIVEKFRQVLKVCYFCYITCYFCNITCERQLEDNSGRFLCIVNAWDPPNFSALSKPRSLSLVFGYKHNQNFSKIKFRNKKSFFWFMEKYLSYNFHIWKNAFHRVFIQFSVSMDLYEIVWQEVSHIWKLYDKKFWSTQVVSLNSIWNDFVVRDSSPRVSNSRYALSNMNKLFKARII